MSVATFERFSKAISMINRHWHKIATDELTQYGLKGVHATYMTVMERYEDGITGPQLCELCGKDKSDVSRMMKLLIEKGMVTKKGDFRGCYGGLFTLTEKGRDAAERIICRVKLVVKLATQDLSDENGDIFLDSLDLIEKRLDEISENGLPEIDCDAL